MVASTVLMVAEKPSIALSIASALSHGQMSTRKGSTDVHEFDGRFLGHHAHYKVTSVIGHVFSIDFPAGFQDWKTTDPLDLFQASVIKTVSNPKAHIRQHLSREARGCDCLVLWLDCDREGENICFEVIECTGFGGNEIRKKVYRARFSSVTEKDILKALDNLVQPNRNEALAVDARQEIDLKVGVAFTRFQTTFFQGKYGNLDSRLISYGPCQTPTLGFCVQRHLQITTFKPEKFWSVCPYIMQNGYELNLDWERGKLFDCDVTAMFQKRVMEDGIAEVTEISEKQENKVRPSGLNTVNLLKVASSALGFGPQMAMQLAERLYTQGFISYPRTESTAYPSSFDFKGILHSLVKNPEWGDYVRMLLSDGYSKPRSGTDVGDHPPITPMGLATEDMLGRDAWRLYQYVCQHFIGSLSSDCKYIRTKIQFSIAGEIFNCTGSRVMVKGFTSIMPWLAVNEKKLPQFLKGEKIEVARVELYQGNTTPPDYLSESELISLMEKHGIGTDASIPVHINNIGERNYVQVQAGRRLVPTNLGITLIRGYQCIDPDLCLPDIRSFIEQQITLVAKGQADHSSVVQNVLQQFKQKYSYFVKKIDHMDALFEAQFSPLADSGRALSKCGKCLRYMKFISSQPQRLYCGTCEEVYYLPQKGAIKLYKELTCPLDNFELLIFSLPGPEGKSFPLCPYCYNSPPFEGINTLYGAAKTNPSSGASSKGMGMPCFLCPHPTCRHSLITQGVCACPECSGTLVLDPVSAPNWKLNCNKCNCLVFLPQGAHRISTTNEKCADCDSTIIEVDFNKKTTPLEDGATLFVGCILCDEFLHSLLEMKHGKSFFRGRGSLLIDDGKKQSFSLDKQSGKKCIMLGARDLSIVWDDASVCWAWESHPESRFGEVVVILKVWWLEIRGKISSGMLSPATTYAAYVVFRMRERRYFGFDIDPVDAMVGIVGSEHSMKTICLDPYLDDRHQRHRRVPRTGSNLHANNMSRLEEPRERHDGWFETKLGEFHNDGGDDEVEIILKEVKCNDSKNSLVVQGIDIRPKINPVYELW